jgi:hypothetical protein
MVDQEGGEDRGWLLEPAAADEVRIHVEVGPGSELSPEVRDALDTLMQTLHDDEVAGFAITPECPDLAACMFYECTPYGKCTLRKLPCFADIRCQIASIR